MSTDYGLCKCGCGQPTRIAPVNDKSKGWVRGEPLSYVRGHNVEQMVAAKKARLLGAKRLTSHGYVTVNIGEPRRKYEHIIVAEGQLGRGLVFFGKGHPDNEVVHHIDGNKTNNSPENLAVMTHSEHVALHHRLEGDPNFPQFKKVVRNPLGRGAKK